MLSKQATQAATKVKLFIYHKNDDCKLTEIAI